MSDTSNQRSLEFLKISSQFKLGVLITEASHPVTAELSDVAARDISAGLDLLFKADGDVVRKFEEFVVSGRAMAVAGELFQRLSNGGRVFFTGCGSTGRLSIQLVSIWREFWQRKAVETTSVPVFGELEQQAFAVMAGGDFALIKSVEGFEDFTAFGKKQIGELGVSNKDVVFAITEGGETSFVIGTAWKGLECGAKVYFVYNNPDEILCEHVERSREIIQDPRVEKINLTTGPMSITGSTRMQATSIQLSVMMTVLEMVARRMLRSHQGESACPPPETVPSEFLEAFRDAHADMRSTAMREQLAQWVALEETVYRSGRKCNYYAGDYGIDVLTDTTERSPTYCTPPFRKFDDTTATASWAYLFVDASDAPAAWRRILRRPPQCVEWSGAEVLELVGPEKAARTNEIVAKISRTELMRFEVGRNGMPVRRLEEGDLAFAIVSASEQKGLCESGFHRVQLEAALAGGAHVGFALIGPEPPSRAMVGTLTEKGLAVWLKVPKTQLLLDGVTRVTLKMFLNALSTCTMVRLGRVMGNYMIWVVPSNLKLIDRATRYIQKLTGRGYAEANQLLFEIVEYVEPRMKRDQAYPPVVGMAVLRHRHNLTNEEAEKRLMKS